MKKLFPIIVIGIASSLGFQDDPPPGGMECIPGAEFTDDIGVSLINTTAGQGIRVQAKVNFSCSTGDDTHCEVCWIWNIMRKQVGTDDWTDNGGYTDDDDWTITCGIEREETFDHTFGPVTSNYVYRVESGIRDVPCDEAGGTLIGFDEEEYTVP